MLIALEIDQCRQRLVTKSGTVWSHDDFAMAEHALYRMGLTMLGHKISCPAAVDA